MDPPYASLSIASFGDSTLPKETKRVWATKDTNRTSDIDGAQPSATKVWKKPDLWNNSDVDGARPPPVHRERNVANNSLRVDDIDGAQAKIRDKMLLTNRHINPMVPEYKLPKHSAAANVEPKFLRDTLNISDIDKAKPSTPRIFDMRDPISVQDIVGAQANWRPRHAEARLKADPYDIMSIAEVSRNTHRYVDRTKRSSDPLDPRYNIHGDVVEDNARYTKPRGLPKGIPDSHLLQTRDIAGAYPGWTKGGMERREFKNTNITTDIEGAQADTIKHSMVTNRCTHPLDKTYVSLDGDLLVSPVVSLLPASLIKKPTLNQPDHASSSAPNSARGAAHVDRVPNEDSLSIHVKSARRETLVQTNHPVVKNTSPRPPMGAIDSAAYRVPKAPNPEKTGTPKSAWGTPRSAAGSRPGSGLIPSCPSSRPETTIPNEMNVTDAIPFADKFINTEVMIAPKREGAPKNEGSSRPPLAGGNPPKVDKGGVPQLNLTGVGPQSGHPGSSGRGMKGSARLSKAEVERNEDILSVRMLE